MVGNPTMVSGVRGRSDLITNREDTDFAYGVALLDPNENPFTLATMDMSTETSRTIDKHWFEDELVPEYDQINNGAGYLVTDTAIVVDNGDRFSVGDQVRVTDSDEVMLVTGVSGNTLTVVREYGVAEGWTSNATALVDNDHLQIVGNSFMQGHPLPDIKSTQLTEYLNYCQDVRTPMGLSEVNESSAHRGEDDWALQERKIAITHQRKLENIAFWGKPYVGSKTIYASGTGNITPTMSGGINHFIEEYAPTAQKLDNAPAMTQAQFQAFLENVFEYGSGTKMCYCPPSLRTALDAWGISALRTFSSEKMFGVSVDVWNSSHGTVIFKTHKMLKTPQSGAYYYSFFLDMEKVSQVYFNKRGTTRIRKLTPYEATGETVMKQEYQTISCLKFGQPACHARLRYTTFA